MRGSLLYHGVLSAIGLLGICGPVVGVDQPDPALSLGSPISRDKSTIPEWDKLGTVIVEVDRVFLTTPGEKGQTGAIWTRNTNPYTTWVTELTFRASGGERPGGGLAIWYTAQKEQGPIYGSRDLWDGLGIFIDSMGGQGNVRGHLNDGTINYATLPEPKSQAFAQCPLRYRNTGSMVSVKLSVGPRQLLIEVDGRVCFETNKIALPHNYYLGISAASYDNPDSFEVFSFKTTGSDVAPVIQTPKQEIGPDQPSARQQRPDQHQQPHVVNDETVKELVSSGRLVALEKAVESTVEKVNSLREEIESLHSLKPLLERLDQRLGRIESTVSKTEAQFHGATANMHESTKQNIAAEITRLTEKLDAVDHVIREHTSSLVGTIPDTIHEAIKKGGPSVWAAVFVLIAIQAGIAVAYLFYRKRRADYHPKYL
ncbi:concanavalin A-like lectin/glucanase domain-containing protein [Lipomyces orientalis]|uniref:Concanavalin A-like lectin/glucanase domain-containing protein n=1 Tax=Lipomyces orientalis TaxID=1233043 RepID=A0ACC3THQ1_9ASCO